MVNRILTGCLSEAENLVILFFDVVTGMPSRKSHLLPAAVSSLESVTACSKSLVKVAR
ncbi:strA [Enterobacter hormaechei subsp. xiangfangensis]|nr:strA [Enterobacter hormaechei subsp. xiangfangensis]